MTDEVSLNLPTDRVLAKKVIEAGIEGRKIDRGYLGMLFGGKANAPVNVAGLIVVVCLLIISCVLALITNTDLPRRDVFVALIGLVSTALGYLFGRSSR